MGAGEGPRRRRVRLVAPQCASPLTPHCASPRPRGASRRTISEEKNVREMMEVMVAHDVGALAVKKEGSDEVVGIVSERDYLKKVSFGEARVWEGGRGSVMIYQTKIPTAIKRMEGSANRYAHISESEKGTNN